MNEEQNKEPDNKSRIELFSAWALASELGFIVAIPIVIFALLGRFADTYFNTSPWLLLLGVIVSIAISTTLVYKKVTKLF